MRRLVLNIIIFVIVVLCSYAVSCIDTYLNNKQVIQTGANITQELTKMCNINIKECD